MFNLAADALDHMLTKAREKGHIKGVVPHLIPRGVTHLQYADDTIVMVGCDELSIRNLKLLLYCFEWMSGLKINYHKSEVIVFGAEEETKIRIANMLNCKPGALPMRYLGFPISDKKLKMEVFRGTVEKMRKKLQPWKGKNLSSGGRLILTNSSLSSMPTYLMGMYLLHEGIHVQMDAVRSKFFWRGDIDKFKYHMIKWENVCLPRDFGGAGVINTRHFNEALILKWVWRLQNLEEDDICCKLLRAKHFPNNVFMRSRGAGGPSSGKGCKKCV
jgi:hypothetical protein